MFRDGIPYIREGLPIPGTPGLAPVAEQAFSQQPFSDVSIATDGSVAQVLLATDEWSFGPDGTPNPADLDFPTGVHPVLLLDQIALLAGGEPVDVVPGLPASSALIEEISIAKAASSDRVLSKVDVSDLSGTFAPETTILFEITGATIPANQSLALRLTDDDNFTVPGLGFGVSSMNSNEEDVDYNADGDILLAIDIRDEPFNTDGAILHFDADQTDPAAAWTVVAREGQPSPLPGRNYDSLFNNPLALNDAGDVAFLASVDGSTTNDGIIVVNGQVAAQEAATVGTASPGPLQLGFANANIEIDNEANIIWYGAWNTPKANLCPDNSDITSTFAIFEGLFFNDRVLIEGGVTTIENVTVNGTLFPELVIADLPNTGFGGFHVSPDGRWLIFGALVAEPSDDLCAFSINNDATALAQVVLRVDLDQVRADTAVPCNPADLAAPQGFLDLADIDAFIAAFATGDPANDPTADIAPPFGFLDLSDIDAFIASFTAGCP